MPTHFQPIDPSQKIGELSKRVDLIKLCANEAKPIYFEQKWVAVLVRCAQWHSSQPLSADVYREPGGALRWTVELAFYAMRLAGAQKFAANLPSEERRRLEPQYNYGVFIAAVCSGLDEPHRHFQVFRTLDDAQWNPSAHGALNGWLDGSEFRLVRREVSLPVERMRTGVLAQLIVGQELLSALDHEVVAQIFGAINPAPMPMQGESVTHKVVREAIKVATDFDLKAQRAQFAPIEFSVPPAIDVANVIAPVQETVGASPLQDETRAPDAIEPAAEKARVVKRVDPRQISLLDDEPTVPAALATAVTPAASLAPTPAVAEAEATPAKTIEQGLTGFPQMFVDFFRVLKEDIESGKVKVSWGTMGLKIPKKIFAGYGIATDSLIAVLRQKGVLLEKSNTEITVARSIGELLKAREARA